MLLRVGKIGVGVGRLNESELTDGGAESNESVHSGCGLSTLCTGARDVPCMFEDSRFCLDDGGWPCGSRPKTDEGDLFRRNGALHHFWRIGRGKKKEARKRKDGEWSS